VRKVLTISVLSLAGLLLLVFLLLNLSITRRHVTLQVNRIMEKAELPVRLGSLQRVLPNEVEVQGVSITGTEGDTLIQAGRVYARIRLIALLRSRVVIKECHIHGAEVLLENDPRTGEFSIATAFPSDPEKDSDTHTEREKADWSVSIRSGSLEHVRFRMADPASGLHLDAGAGRLGLANFRLDIETQFIGLRSVDAQDLTASVRTEPSMGPEKEALKDPAGDTWQMGLGRARLVRSRITFESPEKDLWLETLLGELSVEVREMDLSGPALDVDRLRIADADLRLHSPGLAPPERSSLSMPVPGADSLLELTGIVVDLRDAQWNKETWRGRLRTLETNTREGEFLASLEGSLDSDGKQTRIELHPRILNSHLAVQGRGPGSPASILRNVKNSSDFTLSLGESRLFPSDLAAFFPLVDSLPPELLQPGVPVLMEGELALGEEGLRVHQLQISQEGGIRLGVEGVVEHPFEPSAIRASFMASAESPLGRVLLDGVADLPADSFSVDGSFHALSTGSLMEGKGPGPVYGTADLRGRGWTPDSLSAWVTLRIDSLYYDSLFFRDLTLEGRYAPDEIAGTFRSEDPSLRGGLEATLVPGDSVLKIVTEGSLEARLDLLGIAGDSLVAKSGLSASLSLFADSMSASLDAMDAQMAEAGRNYDVDTLSATFHSGPEHTSGQLRTDFLDLQADISTPMSGLGRLGEIFADYFRGLRDTTGLLSGNRLEGLPEIRAEVRMREHALLQRLAGDTGIHFTDLQLMVSHRMDQNILTGWVHGDDLVYGNMRSGRLDVLVSDSAAELMLDLESLQTHIGSGPEFMWRAEGTYSGGKAQAGLGIIGKENEVVYGIGLKGMLVDTTLEVLLASDQVILNRVAWEATAPGFLTLDMGSRRIHPDLSLRSGPSNLSFLSVPGEDSGRYRLSMEQVGLDKLWRPELIPGEPSGELNGKVDLSLGSEDRTRVEGSMCLLEAGFAGLDFDSISLGGYLLSEGEDGLKAALEVSMDSSLLELTASRSGEGMMEAEALFRHFPLKTIESLASKQVRDLEGEVSGDFLLSRNGGEPDLSGQVQFTNAGLTVNFLNSPFRIPDQRLRMVDESILFENFRILDTLNKALTLNGTIGIGKGRSTADMEISSNRLKLMSHDPESRAPFSGNIFLDSRFTVRGPLANPNIDGKILLSEGSEIYYQLLESYQLSASEQIVDFSKVEPAGPDSVVLLTAQHREFIRSSVETRVEIDPSTLLNFRLARRIYDLEMNITGGGSVSYALLDNNRSTLSGRYEIAEGEALLKLTGWPDKDFTITEGGYVRWDGKVDDPDLKIQAVNSVRTSYQNPVDGKMMEADFNVTLSMTGYLSALDVSFDVQTTDQYIMRVLNTLSPEEKMQQAVSILLFETIDLPGISSSTDYMTQQVNQIVSSQLNQLTRTNIRGVDISFGLDSYSEPLPGGGNTTNTNLTYEVRKSMMNDRAEFQLKGRIADVNSTPGASDVSLHDISFEYQLDSAASNFLKVYNKQSYDDVFEGEVMKTGIGYTYRRNYETLVDIFRRKKKKERP
jgi:hypothetical protein